MHLRHCSIQLGSSSHMLPQDAHHATSPSSCVYTCVRDSRLSCVSFCFGVVFFFFMGRGGNEWVRKIYFFTSHI